MQPIKAHRSLFQRRAWPLAIAAGGVVIAGLPASTKAASTCTDQSCPTDFITLTSPEIQSTKSSFKFQARISQAKLPVDDVTFSKVFVKLRDGVTTWCSQSLSNVKVRDSVLNLEVGPDTGMTCSMPLEDVIAGKNGLGFQICINNEENCLKPIALSSVPYAVKAEYARRAQQSFEADVAAQAHYAHRIAADLDLLQSPTIGTGYFDFHTPLSALTIPGLNATISNREGVMEWTPIATAEKKLNILLKTDANGAIPASYSRLDELKLHAVVTKNLGKLEVSEGAKMATTLDVTGLTTLGPTAGSSVVSLISNGAAQMKSSMAVTGLTTLGPTAGSATVALATNGAAEFKSTLKVLTGLTTLSGGLTVSAGATNLAAGLNVTSGATALSGGLTVTGGNSSFTSITTSSSATVNGGLTVAPNQATILGGSLDAVNGQTTLSNLKMPSGSSAVFDGAVTFNGSVNLPSAGISAPTLNVSGATTLATLTVGGASTFTGKIAVPMGGLEMGPYDSVVFGNNGNTIAPQSEAATIAGGGFLTAPNTIASSFSFIGGGYGNSIPVSGGTGAFVGAGQNNTANAMNSAILGGTSNAVSATGSAVVGGQNNAANGLNSFIGAGNGNVTSGAQATVGGGTQNTASGANSAVPGGFLNNASGATSLAAGRRAYSTAAGTFTWADTAADADFVNSTVNMFKVRAAGGVQFYTNPAATVGVQVAAGGGSWSSISDRNKKHDIKPLNPKQVLEKLDRVPVATWRYKDEVSQSLHMGPMAQDFYAAFGLGDDDKHIVTVDADGVALAAVKGVHAITKEQQGQIDGLKRELKSAREQNQALEARLAKLESSAGGRASWQGFNLFGGLGFAGMGSLGLMLVATRRRKDLL